MKLVYNYVKLCICRFHRLKNMKKSKICKIMQRRYNFWEMFHYAKKLNNFQIKIKDYAKKKQISITERQWYLAAVATETGVHVSVAVFPQRQGNNGTTRLERQNTMQIPQPISHPGRHGCGKGVAEKAKTKKSKNKKIILFRSLCFFWPTHPPRSPPHPRPATNLSAAWTNGQTIWGNFFLRWTHSKPKFPFLQFLAWPKTQTPEPWRGNPQGGVLGPRPARNPQRQNFCVQKKTRKPKIEPEKKDTPKQRIKLTTQNPSWAGRSLTDGPLDKNLQHLLRAGPLALGSLLA